MNTAEQRASLPVSSSAKSPHALIIEDDDLIARCIEAELRTLGFSSFGFAKTESEAIIFAAEQQPQLITVDAKLEEGSGVRAALKICSERAVPVIVITGSPFQITIPGVVTLGKPFSSAAFGVAYEQATERPFLAAGMT